VSSQQSRDLEERLASETRRVYLGRKQSAQRCTGDISKSGISHLYFCVSINFSHCSVSYQLELLLNSLSEGGRTRKGVVGAADLLRQGV
jgi:hypothetical protein